MITPEYARVLAATHDHYGNWGCGGDRHADLVRDLIRRYGCRSVLDFGCGQARLGNILMGRDKQREPLPIDWYDYDPAIPSKQSMPLAADLVVCTHVLEHVEPELLDETIAEIDAIAQKVIYIAVPSGPAHERLVDGRNAHLTQQPPAWWAAKFKPLGLITKLDPKRKRSGQLKDETRFVIVR